MIAQQRCAALDWNRVLPSVAATHNAALHLRCANGDVVFFDPSRSVGALWRASVDYSTVFGPIAVPDFVRGLVALGVSLPSGPAMEAWSSAISGGLVEAGDASVFLLVAAEVDRMEDEILDPSAARH